MEGNVLFYQCASDIIAKSIILTNYKIPVPQPVATKADTTVSLTYDENNALRYAA